MRYSIEYLTRRPTCSILYFTNEKKISAANHPLGNTYEIGIDLDREPVYKMHHMENHANPKKDYLIFLVRNYKECLIRELHNSKKKALLYLLNPQNQFCKNIREFDKWPEERRLLIYYEDLITQPSDVYKKLTAFLDEGTEKVENFIEELDQHRQNCINFYIEYAGPSVTKGKEKLHHSKKFTLEQRCHMDQLIRNNLKNLYDKYLTRYSE